MDVRYFQRLSDVFCHVMRSKGFTIIFYYIDVYVGFVHAPYVALLDFIAHLCLTLSEKKFVYS